MSEGVKPWSTNGEIKLMEEIASLKAEVKRLKGYVDAKCTIAGCWKSDLAKAVELLRQADRSALQGLPSGIRWMNKVSELLEEIDGD